MEIIQPILLVAWSFIEIFLFCNFGEMVTQKYIEVNHAFFECNWYLFPIEIQRHYMPMILMNTQQTVILRGFGNIDITRETFKKVSNEHF